MSPCRPGVIVQCAHAASVVRRHQVTLCDKAFMSETMDAILVRVDKYLNEEQSWLQKSWAPQTVSACLLRLFFLTLVM